MISSAGAPGPRAGRCGGRALAALRGRSGHAVPRRDWAHRTGREATRSLAFAEAARFLGFSWDARRRAGDTPTPGPRTSCRRGCASDPLAAREREVAGLLAGSLSNRAIAEALVLSERTVESHVRSILGKRGLVNRAQVAGWARARGAGSR